MVIDWAGEDDHFEDAAVEAIDFAFDFFFDLASHLLRFWCFFEEFGADGDGVGFGSFFLLAGAVGFFFAVFRSVFGDIAHF